MIIDCISDLHGNYPKLEGGDLLIISGDLTASHSLKELDEFNHWIFHQNYKNKIVVAGNHDEFFEKGVFDPEDPKEGTIFLDPTVNYLCDSGMELVIDCKQLKIWGTPWTPTFPGINPRCTAFTYDNEDFFADKLELVPQDVDILITHGPAYQVLDKTIGQINAGSRALHGFLRYSFRPKLHVFGHIHEAYGQEEKFTGCLSVNASHVDENYNPINAPMRVIL